jgi:hypothetical protein
MKVRRLQLESQQMARIRIQSQMAHLSIDANIRRIKDVQRQHAHMTIYRRYPSLDVDMESLRNNIGLKSIAVLAQDSAGAAFQIGRASCRERV